MWPTQRALLVTSLSFIFMFICLIFLIFEAYPDPGFFSTCETDPVARFLLFHTDLDTALSLSLSDCAPPLYILSLSFSLRLAGPFGPTSHFSPHLFLYVNLVAKLKLPSQKNFLPMFLLLCLLPNSCLCAGHPSTVTTWGRWEWWRRSWRITSCSIPHPHTRQVLGSGRNMYKDDNWYRIQQLCTQITSTSKFCEQLSPYLKTCKELRNRFRQAGNRFLGSLKGLQMRTLTKWKDPRLANLAD